VSYGWPANLQRAGGLAISPTRLEFDGPQYSEFVRAVDREPEPEPERWWREPGAGVVSYLKHLRTDAATPPPPEEGTWGKRGGGIWSNVGPDIVETPVDELRMGLSGLGPKHHARRATFTGPGTSGGFGGGAGAAGGGALELDAGQEEEQAPRPRMKTFGREGLLGW
jgi:hypothetical protein